MHSAAILARNFEKIRLAKSYTHENLALHSGITRSYIANIKKLWHNATLTLVDRLAKALEVEEWHLLAPDLQVESVAEEMPRASSPTALD